MGVVRGHMILDWSKLCVCVNMSTNLQRVGGVVETLSVRGWGSQDFDLLAEPVLGRPVLLHQLGELPLRQDAQLQVSSRLLETTAGLQTATRCQHPYSLWSSLSPHECGDRLEEGRQTRGGGID